MVFFFFMWKQYTKHNTHDLHSCCSSAFMCVHMSTQTTSGFSRFVCFCLRLAYRGMVTVLLNVNIVDESINGCNIYLTCIFLYFSDNYVKESRVSRSIQSSAHPLLTIEQQTSYCVTTDTSRIHRLLSIKQLLVCHTWVLLLMYQWPYNIL